MTISPTKTIAPTPVPGLEGLRPYALPPRPPQIDLHLDLNEGRAPSDAIMRTLAAITPAQARLYESPTALEARIAERWAIDPNRVVVTAGADQAIEATCRAYLAPGRRLLVHTPSFEMIPRSAKLTGGALDHVTWLDGAFPLDDYLAAIAPDTSICTVVTPNNPTGGVLTLDQLRTLADRAAVHGAILLVDLAYAEFADEDPQPALSDLPNCVFLRTFSKAFGLAGLRIGYAVAEPAIADALRTVVGPFPVSTPATLAAATALDHPEATAAFTARVRTERDELTRLLTQNGVAANPSQGNFVLARTPDPVALRDALADRGIAVRVWPGREHLTDTVRIALPGDEADFARLTAALNDILGAKP